MFSDQIYLDVVGLIDCVLDQMPTPEVIDEITIVQGYLQLSLGEHGLYDGKVQVGLDALLKLARHEDKQGLIHALQDVLEAMDREQDTRPLWAGPINGNCQSNVPQATMATKPRLRRGLTVREGQQERRVPIRTVEQLAESYERWAADGEALANRIIDGLKSLGKELQVKHMESAEKLLEDARQLRQEAARLRELRVFRIKRNL